MERRSRLLATPAAHEFQQPIEVERLLQEIDAVQIACAGLGLIERGEHDHGNIGEGRVVLLAPAEFPPVHDRHHQVEQDDVRPGRLVQVFEGLTAVGNCFDLVPFERQQLRHHLTQICIVFDNEDGAGRRHVYPV